MAQTLRARIAVAAGLAERLNGRGGPRQLENRRPSARLSPSFPPSTWLLSLSQHISGLSNMPAPAFQISAPILLSRKQAATVGRRCPLSRSDPAENLSPQSPDHGDSLSFTLTSPLTPAAGQPAQSGEGSLHSGPVCATQQGMVVVKEAPFPSFPTPRWSTPGSPPRSPPPPPDLPAIWPVGGAGCPGPDLPDMPGPSPQVLPSPIISSNGPGEEKLFRSQSADVEMTTEKERLKKMLSEG